MPKLSNKYLTGQLKRLLVLAVNLKVKKNNVVVVCFFKLHTDSFIRSIDYNILKLISYDH